MNLVLTACPACGTPHVSQEAICQQCGLVFASQAQAVSGPTIPISLPSPSATFTYRPLQPGRLLANGAYTVAHALSHGGMGAIYLATDHHAFDRMVVIKAMLDYFDPNDPQQVQIARDRFLQEARTLSTLRHPAIPQIFTYFQDGAQNYIVMEYIEGQSLEQRVTRRDDATGRIIPGTSSAQRDVIQWGIELCRVLEYLATRQPYPVVHHDIKPANLLFDSNSKEIRLVDFGTAKARLLMQPGGNVGLQKSSIYGTQGYAPLEQYNGQSEPRSDIYALAATLYHLATDDDPGMHPFDFPCLNTLGTLGHILETALQADVKKRPTASQVRRELETLLTPKGTRAIQAPDRTQVSEVHELAAWCEQHWEDAVQWLYGSLPDQLETVWGRTADAHQLRIITTRNGYERDAGLDNALALLDPSGFGAALPSLVADKYMIDYGELAISSSSEQQLTLINNGRRYIQAWMLLPSWLTINDQAITLVPSQRTILTLTAHPDPALLGGIVQGDIVVHMTGRELLRLPAQLTSSPWHTAWQHFAKPIGIFLGFFVAPAIGCVLGSLMNMILELDKPSLELFGAIAGVCIWLALIMVDSTRNI